MKIFRNISKAKLQIVLGLVLAIFVLSQSYIPQAHNRSTTDDQTEQSLEINAPSATVPSTFFELDLGFQSFLIAEVDHSVEKNEQKSLLAIAIHYPVKAIRVIFNSLISPNAP